MRRSLRALISPASSDISPATIRSSVVLPAPLGPTRPDAHARLDVQTGVVEDDLGAEGLGDVGEVEHGVREDSSPEERGSGALGWAASSLLVSPLRVQHIDHLDTLGGRGDIGHVVAVVDEADHP